MSALGQKRTFRDSLDQLVGALLDVKRNPKSECLGGPEIDDELEFGRQLNRKIARFSPLNIDLREPDKGGTLSPTQPR